MTRSKGEQDLAFSGQLKCQASKLGRFLARLAFAVGLRIQLATSETLPLTISSRMTAGSHQSSTEPHIPDKLKPRGHLLKSSVTIMLHIRPISAAEMLAGCSSKSDDPSRLPGTDSGKAVLRRLLVQVGSPDIRFMQHNSMKRKHAGSMEGIAGETGGPDG